MARGRWRETGTRGCDEKEREEAEEAEKDGTDALEIRRVEQEARRGRGAT